MNVASECLHYFSMSTDMYAAGHIQALRWEGHDIKKSFFVFFACRD